MSRDEIAALPQDELTDYFNETARYDWRCKENPYSIWFGGMIASSDTADLSKRFYVAVKRYRGTLQGKNGAFSR